jgi:hypothetical protein
MLLKQLKYLHDLLHRQVDDPFTPQIYHYHVMKWLELRALLDEDEDEFIQWGRVGIHLFSWCLSHEPHRAMDVAIALVDVATTHGGKQACDTKHE